MPERVSVEEVVTRISKGVPPPLIAIDGLPCAGKGSLVDKLREQVDLDCIELDDFVLPEEHWPSLQPAFPFLFIRYDAFLDAVKTLSATGRCSYYPFDWNTRLLGSPGVTGVDATVAAWDDGQSWLDEILAQLRANRDWLAEASSSSGE